MKISSALHNLLTNKIVLNIVCVLSALNMIGYLVTNNFTAILFFIVLAILIVQFNKNMIIVLGISLIITFISTLGMKVKEGLENNTTSTTTTPPVDPTTQRKPVGTTTPPNLNAVPSTTTTATTTPTAAPETTTTTESMGSMTRKRGSLDNAASVSDTENDLSMLNNGAGNMNMNTEELLKQQAQLTEAMKNMGPLIESAKSLMNGMNFDGLNNLASSLVSKK